MNGTLNINMTMPRYVSENGSGSGSGNGGNAKVIYSLDEVDTGNKWFDGRKIYRKCFNWEVIGNMNGLANNAAKSFTTLADLGAKMVVHNELSCIIGYDGTPNFFSTYKAFITPAGTFIGGTTNANTYGFGVILSTSSGLPSIRVKNQSGAALGSTGTDVAIYGYIEYVKDE
jgi:hypothetical protein